MSYGGPFASYYDLFYGSKDYRGESQFLDDVIRSLTHKKPSAISILELACGTGNHSRHLADIGYSIIATDASAAMIAEAHRKVMPGDTRISFREMDMQFFHEFDSPFDVVICLFDSIGYLLSNEAILTALMNVRRNLRPDGIFIMEFWNAGAMIKKHEPYREKFFPEADRIVKRISETQIHYREQQAEVTFSILVSDKGGDYRPVVKETHRNRFFLHQEMNFFLTQAGLKPIHFYPGFTRLGVPEAESWHTVAISTTL